MNMDCIRKVTEQAAREIKACKVSSMVLASAPLELLLWFPQWWTMVGMYKPNKAFSPQVGSGPHFIIVSNSKPIQEILIVFNIKQTNKTKPK